MARLFEKKWFFAALTAVFILALFFCLSQIVRLDGAQTEEEHVYLLAAFADCKDPEVLASGVLPEQPDKAADVTENAALLGIPPLYPLVLRFSYGFFARAGFTAALIPSILNLCFLLLTLAALWFAGWRLTGSARHALLVPMLFGLSLPAFTTLHIAAPYALCAMCAAMTAAFLLRLSRKPRSGLCYLGVTLASLGGFLAYYPFAIFALCAALVFSLVSLFRRRISGSVTAPIAAAAGLLAAFILYPSMTDHIFSAPEPFSASYPARVRALLTPLSRSLFGGVLPWVLLACLLAGIALLILRFAKKKELHAPASADSAPGERAEDAAYRRRVARRTETAQPVQTDGGLAAGFLTAGLTAAAYLFTVVLVHYAPPSLAAAADAGMPDPGLLYLLYPLLLAFFAGYCYQALLAISGRRGTAVFFTALIFLALAVISFAGYADLQALVRLPLFAKAGI